MRFDLRVVLMLVLLLAAGCSPGPGTQVSGKILLDGQPLGGAQVQLLPQGEGGQGMHTTTTDAEGAFTIVEDAASNNPLQPGLYVVLVSKMGLPDNHASLPGGGMGATFEVVPAHYRDRTSSPLTIDVQSAKVEAPPFELKSAAK